MDTVRSPNDLYRAVVTERLHANGVATHEQYCRNGKMDRADGPAWIWRNADGVATEEQYFRNGKMHRDDGPARIVRNPDGSTWEMHCRNGKTHRDDGPAIIQRKADGSMEQQYYQNGRLVKTEHLNSDGVVVQQKTATAPSAGFGPNRYAELKKAPLQSVTVSTPRAPQRPRAPGMAP